MSLAKIPSFRPFVRPPGRTKTFVRNSDSEKLERRNRQLERASERRTDGVDRQERGERGAAEERRTDGLTSCRSLQEPTSIECASDRASARPPLPLCCVCARVHDGTLSGSDGRGEEQGAAGGVADQLRE